MNLPNKLTVIRIMLVPFFILTMLWDFPHHYLITAIIFGIASITDALDGKIARKRDLITDFGKFADPLADKILVISALVCFVQLGLCDAVLVIVTVFREFCVTSIRLIAASKGNVVAANMWGKVKTVSQIIAIFIVFLLQYALEITEMVSSSNSQIYIDLNNAFFLIGMAALWISALFTIISGIKYIVDNKLFISDY